MVYSNEVIIFLYQNHNKFSEINDSANNHVMSKWQAPCLETFFGAVPPLILIHFHILTAFLSIKLQAQSPCQCKENLAEIFFVESHMILSGTTQKTKMKVYIVFFQVQSWEYGTPETQMYFFKTKEKAIDKANQLHDLWSHHRYKRIEHYFDNEEKKCLLKDSTKCYKKDNPERYRECFLDEAIIWMVTETLHLEEDMVFSTKLSHVC